MAGIGLRIGRSLLRLAMVVERSEKGVEINVFHAARLLQ